LLGGNNLQARDDLAQGGGSDDAGTDPLVMVINNMT
jgi:hypothetical protein